MGRRGGQCAYVVLPFDSTVYCEDEHGLSYTQCKNTERDIQRDPKGNRRHKLRENREGSWRWRFSEVVHCNTHGGTHPICWLIHSDTTAHNGQPLQGFVCADFSHAIAIVPCTELTFERRLSESKSKLGETDVQISFSSMISLIRVVTMRWHELISQV